MKRKTKIVCTLGPATDSREAIARLIDAGMNVARLNCSHGDWTSKRRWFEWIREIETPSNPIAILADLSGPKFRLGSIPGRGREFAEGQVVRLGPGGDLPVEDQTILSALTNGDRVLFGDGSVEVKVLGALSEGFQAKVLRGGRVGGRQGLTIVGKSFAVSPLTDKDLDDIRQAAEMGVDYIALSYVRHGSDMELLRAEVNKYDRTIGLCAKIETKSALKEIADIARLSDLVMVARGDLGLQMDLEDVPHAQKKIIRKCLEVGKPVVTATQMLESMVVASRPTRAEATDIANAILDGTDAVMLSGETAVGKYPVEAVRYMARIAERAESAFNDADLLREEAEENLANDHTRAVAFGVAQLAAQIKPKAILTNTTSGQTARLVSKFRPRAPILCATYTPRVLRRLAAVWGVEAILVPLATTTDALIQNAIGAFVHDRRLKVGDVVVISAGVPAGTPGNTNLIMVQGVR